MKILLTAIIIIALGLGSTAYYFYDAHSTTQESLESLQDRARTLEKEKAAVTRELEQEIAKISEEKEKEINRLKGTYDELVDDLKGEIEQGQVKITQLADRLSVSMVDKILFPSGKAEITSNGAEVLRRVGDVLKNTEGKIIRVEGHTDNIPISSKLRRKFPTNWELSTARATNVVRFLQEQVEIDPVRLQAVGMSEYHPVVSNETVEGRSQNRRIEIALLPELPQDSSSMAGESE